MQRLNTVLLGAEKQLPSANGLDTAAVLLVQSPPHEPV